jgi:hypothetical protein
MLPAVSRSLPQQQRTGGNGCIQPDAKQILKLLWSVPTPDVQEFLG